MENKMQCTVTYLTPKLWALPNPSLYTSRDLDH